MNRGPASIRQNPAYRRLLAASTITNIGDGIGVIAYPWLASAVTRSPFLIALVVVAQRLPWMLFTLPAGVITDRVDRRRLIVTMDVCRAVLTTAVALAVFLRQSDLPSPDDLSVDQFSSTTLYVLLVVATLLLGCAEVLRDNSAQTLLPSIVEPEGLETANGRLQTAELVSNAFVGPPLGSVLLIAAFSLPFFVDALTFAVAAALVAAIPGDFGPRSPNTTQRAKWTADLGEGFRWLWHHRLFRTLALALGVMNMLDTMVMSTLVLFGQEVLGTSATEFAFLLAGAAAGGVIGGLTTTRLTNVVGQGGALWLTLISTTVTGLVIGLTSSLPLTFVMMAIGSMLAMSWNIITVSLRQSVIPDELLGRVNSVYRFFGWGMMPIGALLGGLTVSVADSFFSRETALRIPWIIGAVGHLILFAVVARRLSTPNIEAARRGET